MKKSLLLAILPLLALSYGYAQSIFPLDGSSAGIGTNIPSSYFHGGNNKVLEILNSNTSLHSQAHLILSTGAVTPNSSAGTITWIAKNATNTKGLAYIASNTEGDASVNAAGNLVFATSNGNTVVERMRINSLGNVGIGTSNPQTTLSVKGYTLPTNQWSGYTSSLQVGELMIQEYGIVPQVAIEQNTYYDGATKYILNGYASSLGLGPNGNINFTVYNSGVSGNIVSGTGIAMTIANNGKVGIGTTNPDAKLAVNGTIHATEIKVDQSVPTPDYVFDKDYDLASLKDVKTYIDKNHHLPEIPSAAQVAKDGINLGEMNVKLLKKVEELTLYLIELKESSERHAISQQAQINHLRKQLKTLKKN